MTAYITIDGDDIGNKIATAYYDNNEKQLSTINEELNAILANALTFLKSSGFEMVFFAADGIVCKGDDENISKVAAYVKSMGRGQYTFSAGVGIDLRSAFIALKYAKSTGKDRSMYFNDNSGFREVIP